MKFIMVCLYFEFQIKKITLILELYWISLFSSFWIINTEKVSLQQKAEGWKQILLTCSVNFLKIAAYKAASS